MQQCQVEAFNCVCMENEGWLGRRVVFNNESKEGVRSNDGRRMNSIDERRWREDEVVSTSEWWWWWCLLGSTFAWGLLGVERPNEHRRDSWCYKLLL